MRRVSSTYARTHLSEIVDNVLSGQELVITRRGKEVARLLPIHQATPKEPIPLKELAEFRATMPKLRKSSTDLLQEMRDESR